MSKIIPIKSISCGNTGRFYIVCTDGRLFEMKSIADMTFDSEMNSCFITDNAGIIYRMGRKVEK